METKTHMPRSRRYAGLFKLAKLLVVVCGETAAVVNIVTAVHGAVDHPDEQEADEDGSRCGVRVIDSSLMSTVLTDVCDKVVFLPQCLELIVSIPKRELR